jgi:hypothetical protein
MNPRRPAAAAAKTDVFTSPFEQISQLENEQEARVLSETEKYAEESREAEKAMQNSEKLHEEKLRDTAREELKEYARTEPAAILTQAEAETVELVKSIDKNASKQMQKEAESLVSNLTDGSLFSLTV